METVSNSEYISRELIKGANRSRKRGGGAGQAAPGAKAVVHPRNSINSGVRIDRSP